MSLSGSAAANAPPWVIASGPLPPALRMAPEAVAVSGNIEPSSGSPGIDPANLPAPRGAELITDLAAVRHGQIEEQLTRLFGGLREPFEQQAPGDSYLYWTALAVAALEAARRWRGRSTSTQGPRHSRRFRNFVINGL